MCQRNFRLTCRHQASLWRGVQALAIAVLLVTPTWPGAARGAAHAPATLQVTKTADTLDGACDADCSLREAIVAANALSGADTILVPGGTYTVTLAGTEEDYAATGDLDLRDSVAFSVTGSSPVTVSSAYLDRVLDVLTGTVVLDGLSLVDGSAPGRLGGVLWVRPGATVTLRAGTIASGDAFEGGGVANAGTLQLELAQVAGNQAEWRGGGIANFGELTVLSTTVASNEARNLNGITEPVGGGIYNAGLATLSASTLSANQAVADYQNAPVLAGAYGGGVYNVGTLTATNTTFSSNRATANEPGSSGASGGGLYSVGSGTGPGQVWLYSVTLTGNRANSSALQTQGGGLAQVGGAISIANTLIAANVAPFGRDCSGTLTSLDHNLVGNPSGCTLTGQTTHNILNVTPSLGPLQLNGGPTATHYPYTFAAGNGSVAYCPAVDQRGVPRPQGHPILPRCDIGAVEVEVVMYLLEPFVVR